MSKSKKYKNNDPEDLLRYSTNGLSDEERNALEREAQKDPFVEEALEGYSRLEPAQAREDIERLHSRLNRRVSGRRPVVWVAAAASIAVILTLGTLYLTVFTDTLGGFGTRVAESEKAERSIDKADFKEVEAPAESMEEKTDEDAGKGVAADQDALQDSELTREMDSRPVVENDAAIAAGTQEVPAAEETGTGAADETGIPGITAEEPEAAIEMATVEDEEISFEQEIVLAETTAGTDSTGIIDHAGAEVETGTEVARAAAPRVQRTELVQPVALEETTSERALTQDRLSSAAKKSRIGSAVSSVQEIPDSIPSIPDGGIESFNRYIRENVNLPDGVTIEEYATVILTFSLGPTGRPQNIFVEESPGEEISREAIRLLQEGPSWSQAYEYSSPVALRNRVSIEFRQE